MLTQDCAALVLGYYRYSLREKKLTGDCAALVLHPRVRGAPAWAIIDAPYGRKSVGTSGD